MEIEERVVRRVLLWSGSEILDYMMALESPLEGVPTGPAQGGCREGQEQSRGTAVRCLGVAFTEMGKTDRRGGFCCVQSNVLGVGGALFMWEVNVTQFFPR